MRRIPLSRKTRITADYTITGVETKVPGSDIYVPKSDLYDITFSITVRLQDASDDLVLSIANNDVNYYDGVSYGQAAAGGGEQTLFHTMKDVWLEEDDIISIRAIEDASGGAVIDSTLPRKPYVKITAKR